MKLKDNGLNDFNRLIGAEPQQHGTPAPTDAETAASHPNNCRCCACWDVNHPEEPQNSEQNNLIWDDSILHENTD